MVPVAIGRGVTDKACSVGAVSPAPHIADVVYPDPVVAELASGCEHGGAYGRQLICSLSSAGKGTAGQ